MLPETKWEQQSRRGKVANNYSDQRKSIPTASAMHLDHGLTVMGLCPVVTGILTSIFAVQGCFTFYLSDLNRTLLFYLFKQIRDGTSMSLFFHSSPGCVHYVNNVNKHAVFVCTCKLFESICSICTEKEMLTVAEPHIINTCQLSTQDMHDR